MTERLVSSMEPEEIGEFVASEIANGETYVLIHDAPLLSEDLGQREELSSDRRLVKKDKDERAQLFEYTRRYERYKNMLRICKNLAVLQDGDMDALGSLQTVGRRSDDEVWKNNPRSEYVHFHTEEASCSDPSRIVSYWNAQTRGGTGDIIKILSVDHLIEKEAINGPLAAVAEMQQARKFYRDGNVTLPILDMDKETVRYDPNQTSMSNLAEPIKELFRDAKDDATLVDIIELGPGDALFIDNTKAFHSVEFPVSLTRLTYKLLLYGLKADEGMSLADQ